ncbi:Cys-tRNA(Pro) deacylase [Lentilactobacillus hilgardii]|uniref:Cys-tRNA(Pro)/Cys-tRNA(Cys) deacylase n=1 Tax=Lentilactobacillus hilgardii (strain ATCC 8290 / DSM 20176 / CCUG 30140 / JCM 1155 / KCTC 3500 / NBRC 15886 / NCIMB 8040 / NRRL B-1843 / 9) TaxID=1423757 RepID=C0XGF4_LENH9|nr:Cys-tRNA(Pro) deacylase [Lentilactobacillus hilgardii]EEI19649.1 YbaK/EbsC protein [Lentilactobacillus buchneri ATCC 11577]EEI25550.1 YbaK/EbsC protein [Lentilactobacillus hilgardii DSM 20176 = ATCC 8290]KRK56648.1 transcriptional regulator [Lentilactobacillus hilgardii DSM 20176 = ATCC 8290]MCP9333466.1 Cys-tRNA(Pro) deacylase [Lentilactobacillus hilgardii]MCP9350043.1 Cys-tRNA(Pro) deacylase [Lentilactobacillus hilgardii]
MSKKKRNKVHKTLVEQILDKNKVPFEQMTFPTHQEGDVEQISVDHLDQDEHQIFKTLVLTGKTTGPVVGVIPVDEHLDEKKLAKASGNKKVTMVPLKELLKTTGYQHGANTPIGIWEKFKYPIYIDQEAQKMGKIIVSSGQIGRSVKVDAEQMRQLVHGSFTDLKEK